ncbi:14427_t:CDS:1, partial [Ambispora leptoticha]
PPLNTKSGQSSLPLSKNAMTLSLINNNNNQAAQTGFDNIQTSTAGKNNKMPQNNNNDMQTPLNNNLKIVNMLATPDSNTVQDPQNKMETDSASTISANYDTPNTLIYSQAAKQNLTGNQMQLDEDPTQKWLEHIHTELNKEISQLYNNTI